jgi:hypothetical protein
VEAEKEISRDLQGLLVEEGEQAIDSLLRTALEPYIAFTRAGRMITKPQFLELSDPAKILVALLGRLAMVRLHLPGAKVEASAEQMQSECMIPLKSTREYLSRHKSRRLLEKNASGYFVPTWSVAEVVSTLRGKH